MANIKYLLYSIIPIFLFGIVYVSILGENSLIEKNVENFFKLVHEGKYGEACQLHGTQDLCRMDTDINPQSINILAFELALLKHYDLFKDPRYTAEAKTTQTWIPYLGSSEISVDVRLCSNANTLIDFLIEDDVKYVKNLISVKRVAGQWRISKVNITNSAISREYTEMLEKSNIKKYIFTNGNTVGLQNIEIDTKNTTAEERKIISNILQWYEAIAGEYKYQ